MNNPMIEAQVERIWHEELPELIQHMPYNSWCQPTLSRSERGWRFVFRCNAEACRFFAAAIGSTPMEAFLIVKHHLANQMRRWHDLRFGNAQERSRLESLALPVTAEIPKVLIVDDDLDTALSMQVAFKQLGCETEVATQHEGLHHKLISSQADYIFLDWRLNDQVTAGEVVEKAVRLIETFSDLQEKFLNHRPRIVTYSALKRGQIALPHHGDHYFKHLDHWEKPMPFTEVIERASEVFLIPHS
ncbi:MAG: hypothetical protein AB7N80_15770 [Bdellovibrionales bacterium]